MTSLTRAASLTSLLLSPRHTDKTTVCVRTGVRRERDAELEFIWTLSKHNLRCALESETFFKLLCL